MIYTQYISTVAWRTGMRLTEARFFPRNSGRKKAPKKGRIIACLISLTVFFRLVYSMANNSFANVAEFLWTGRREPAHN